MAFGLRIEEHQRAIATNANRAAFHDELVIEFGAVTHGTAPVHVTNASTGLQLFPGSGKCDHIKF
jgi:hypothetical protein